MRAIERRQPLIVYAYRCTRDMFVCRNRTFLDGERRFTQNKRDMNYLSRRYFIFAPIITRHCGFKQDRVCNSNKVHEDGRKYGTTLERFLDTFVLFLKFFSIRVCFDDA